MSKTYLKFGQYIRGIRESRNMTVFQVGDWIKKNYSDSRYHWSKGHYNKMENGRVDVGQVGYCRLESLSQFVGESPEFLLYKAGLREKNPYSDGKKKDMRELSKELLNAICEKNKRRYLTETEVESMLAIMNTTVLTLTEKK